MYLVVYTIFARIDAMVDIAFCMMLFAPLLMLWLAFTVLKFGKYNGAELKDGEEFGYQDKAKSDLGMF